MFSSPSTTVQNRRSLASAALRGAGLVKGNLDGDISMMEAPGGVKRSSRNKLHERPTRSKRLEKMEQSASAAAKNSSLAARLKAPGSTVAIKGAGLSGPSPASLSGRIAAGPRAGGARIRNIITEPGTRGKPVAASVEVLRQVVNRRWNPDLQFLNLERLAEDEIMKKHKIAPLESRDAPKQLGPVLFKLAGELHPPCKTISLANNNLTSTYTLQTLNHYLPGLNALSLENNKIRNLRDLDGLSQKAAKGTLSSITELVLRGNPIRETSITEGHYDDFKRDVSRRFPALSVLDQESIVRVAFDVEASTVNVASTSAPTHPVATSFPVPMQPSLFLDNVDGVTAQFLTQYFTFFDNKRSDLGVVYTPHATFSLSANTSIPPRARKAGFQHSARMPNQKALNWEFYHAQSRNLERISNSSRAPDKAVKLLHTGPQEISNALLQMPRTRHDMSNGQNFVVDAFPMVGMLNGGEYGDDALIINIHGEFAEGPSWGVRSFDRTFGLALAPPGSPAQLAGWQCIILSDILVVRSYSSPEAWKPGNLAVGDFNSATEFKARAREPHEVLSRQQREATNLAPGPSTMDSGMRQPPSTNNMPASLVQLQSDPIVLSLPEQQQNLLLQFVQATGLTIMYAGQCLEGNGWDLQQAHANLLTVRNTLPPEAFLTRP